MPRKQVSRSQDGRIQGSISYWLNLHEDECWKDQKCKDVRFPQYTQKMHSDVKVYHISELNNN